MKRGAKNHWLQVRLQGASDNRQGIGARVAVLRKNQTPLWRHVHTDGSYLSAHDSRVHFGLGSDPNLQGVLVHWPGGTREVFEGIKPDAIVTLRQGPGSPSRKVDREVPSRSVVEAANDLSLRALQAACPHSSLEQRNLGR